jgi:hypothetical protein
MATITLTQNATHTQANRADLIVRNTRRMRQIDTKAYLSSQSSKQMFAKTATILASTGICAGIGAGYYEKTLITIEGRICKQKKKTS